MQAQNITLEIRTHPLDPRRIGPEGLVARLFGKLEAAVNDPEFTQSYTAMTKALVTAPAVLRAG